MKLARQAQVVAVAALAAQQHRVFLAVDRLADGELEVGGIEVGVHARLLRDDYSLTWG